MAAPFLVPILGDVFSRGPSPFAAHREVVMTEPLSLILLGVTLALVARRLRRMTGAYGKNVRTGSSHRISTPPVSGN